MKKIIIISIATYVICSAFKTVQSNKKIVQANSESMFVDYRDSYVGTYSCRKHSNELSSETHRTIHKSSSLIIVISKDALDSVLQLNANGKITKAKLKNGFILPYPDGGKYGGRFFSDSLDLNFNHNRASFTRIIGKKI